MSTVDTSQLNALQVSALNTKNNEALMDGSLNNPLERFECPVRKQGVSMFLHIETSEFTSLCPVTSQPDFATIIIDYTPDKYCVESKSLKMYYLTYRNRRDFHEACVNQIANDLIDLLDPISLTVKGEFTPRGGIPFWPTVNYTRPF